MSRHLQVLIVALAMIAIGEPLMHSHPLESSTSATLSTCAVCSSAVRIAPAAPSVEAPSVVAYALTPVSASAVVDATPLVLASRAPPAA